MKTTAQSFSKKLSSGFTLIELLVVIAVLAVLALAVLAAIDPAAKIKSAKDTNVKSDMGQLVNALQAYVTDPASGNLYPLTAAGLNALVPGELKSLPQQQTGFTACAVSPNGATTGTNYCYAVNAGGTVASVWGSLFPASGTSYWCWTSSTGAYKASATPPTQASLACP